MLPAPRTPDPTTAPTLNWGVLGTGWIAERFVDSVRRHTRQRFTGAASRSPERAEDFATRHDIPRAHSSYESLVADPEIDVVYIATPHTSHHPCARLALEAGKHVLVEKPLALNAAQGAELAQLAADRGLFCAEALWTFFLPRFDVVRQILDSGALGEIRTVLADLGEHFDPAGGHRIFDPSLAGGPLLDLGTYPVSLATWVLGAPDSVQASGQPHPAGVNGQLGAVLTNTRGDQAVLHTTLFSDTPTTATIAGTLGTLTLPGPFYQPGDIVLTQSGGGASHTYTEPPVAHDGLHFEAAEVARCIADGLPQTPVRPLADSLTTLRVMDEIRRQCGIAFPGE